MSKLRVGINSYLSLSEAAEYISEHYTSSSDEYKAWFTDSLSDADKEAVLISSAQALNNLKYTGRKKVAGQKLAFPRINMLMPGIYYTPFVVQAADTSLISCGFGFDDGFELAKSAQVENAVAYLLYGCVITSTKRRALSGIKSKSVDNVSESYDNSLSALHEAEMGLYEPHKVKALLKAWLDESVYTL